MEDGMNIIPDNKWIRYFVILFMYTSFLLIGFKLESVLMENAAVTYSMLPYFIFSILFPITIGILLALPKQRTMLTTNITINWPRLLILSIPALFILFLPVFFFKIAKLVPFISFLYGNEKMHFIAGIIFGYVVLTSIEAKSNKDYDKKNDTNMKG
jgi:hypothetical protein